MHSLRSRLIFSHIVPVLIIVPLMALIAYGLLATQGALTSIESVLAEESQRLGEQAGLVAELAGAMQNIWSDPQSAENFVADIDLSLSTVTLLDTQGRVLASSGSPALLAVGEELRDEHVSAVLRGESKIQLTVRDARTGQTMADVLVPVFNLDQQLAGVILLSREVGAAQQYVRRSVWLLALAFTAMLFLGVALGAYFALRLARAMQRVTETVAKIAAGNTPASLPEQDITEIDGLYQEVNALVDRLRALEETRRRLLANLVHELGRPLGALRAAVYALSQGADDDMALRHELLDGMDDQLERMEPLLDDLTRLHGQLLGSLELCRSQMPLSQWLPSVLPLWQQTAEQKGLRWRVDIPLNLPAIAIDPDQMGRAIGNLLTNAIKYTEPGGEVSVEAGIDARGELPPVCWIRVRDTGSGVASVDQTRIFDAFQRSTADRRFPQGMGLGLTIAQDTVAAHGGDIKLETKLGQGSTFTICLPIDNEQ